MLLECLEWLRTIRDNRKQLMLKERRQETLDDFREAEEKTDIMMDIIHYLDTDEGRCGMADWQVREMMDPEKCRREAMDFANENTEREPMEPIMDRVRNRRCPRCNTILKGRFCHECGQEVKWHGGSQQRNTQGMDGEMP